MAGRNRKGQFTKRKRGAARRSGGTTTKIVRVPSGAAPTIRVSAPRAPARRTVRHVRRRSSGGGSILGRFGGRTGSRTAILIGSAALGYASKEGWLAKLPLVGKAGPLTSFGILGWGAEELLKLRLPPIVQDMITSALAISAFNFGLSGGSTISGEEAYVLPGGAVVFD